MRRARPGERRNESCGPGGVRGGRLSARNQDRAGQAGKAERRKGVHAAWRLAAGRYGGRMGRLGVLEEGEAVRVPRVVQLHQPRTVHLRPTRTGPAS
jgi:hypothetical protein